MVIKVWDCTLAILRERFRWSNIYLDVVEYVTKYHQHYIAKGHHTGLQTQQGSLVANNPVDLLCIDFTMTDPPKDDKEDILVLTDAFTKFSQALITNSHKAHNVTKILVDRWFLNLWNSSLNT